MKKAYSKHLWFKSKGYTHFSPRLTVASLPFVAGYVSRKENIISHKFHPLIHRVLVSKKLKLLAGTNEKKHYEVTTEGKRKSTAKFRHIYYSDHLDSNIYSYYTNKELVPLYENVLNNPPGLSNCICAYRKVPIHGKKRKKCNIDFANDAFNAIDAMKVELVALSFDIKSFFDTLDHVILKHAWAKLLNPTKKTLPEDHFKIFRSITKFVYVDFYDLLKEFEIKHPDDVIDKEIPRFLKTGSELKSRIINKGLLKLNSFRNSEHKMCGIPQGTPISAFLANVYLLEFDKTIFQKVVVELNGIYKRYSDDIIVICKPENRSEVEALVLEEIKKYKLEIQTKKTQITYFNEKGRIISGNKPLQYLGFEYDGDRVLLKSASLAKFYRKMKKSVHFRSYITSQKRAKGDFKAQLHKKRLYKAYSHYGSSTINPVKRNYFSYAYNADRTMNKSLVKKQLSKSWNTLNSEIKRYSERYELDSKDEYNGHISI